MWTILLLSAGRCGSHVFQKHCGSTSNKLTLDQQYMTSIKNGLTAASTYSSTTTSNLHSCCICKISDKISSRAKIINSLLILKNNFFGFPNCFLLKTKYGLFALYSLQLIVYTIKCHKFEGVNNRDSVKLITP